MLAGPPCLFGRLASGSLSQLSTPTLDKMRPIGTGKRESTSKPELVKALAMGPFVRALKLSSYVREKSFGNSRSTPMGALLGKRLTICCLAPVDGVPCFGGGHKKRSNSFASFGQYYVHWLLSTLSGMPHGFLPESLACEHVPVGNEVDEAAIHTNFLAKPLPPPTCKSPFRVLMSAIPEGRETRLLGKWAFNAFMELPVPIATVRIFITTS